MLEDIIGESKKEEKKEIKIKSKDSKDGNDPYDLQKQIWEWIKEQQDEDGDPFFLPIFWR